MQTDVLTRNFFRLLRAGLFADDVQLEPLSAWKWHTLYAHARTHGVAAILYDGVRQCSGQYHMQQPNGLQAAPLTSHLSPLNSALPPQTTLATLTALAATYGSMQLRPLLLGAQALAPFYPHPFHRQARNVVFYFPFSTQGRKADDWASAHAAQPPLATRHRLRYSYDGTPVEHRHRIALLAHRLHERTLQHIAEQELRESQATYVEIKGTRVETLPPTLTLLALLLHLAQTTIDRGVPQLCNLADLAIFLRKLGHRADYVKLQEWLEQLGMQPMAGLMGHLLTGLLGFTADEVPFLAPTDKPSAAAQRVASQLFATPRGESLAFTLNSTLTSGSPSALLQQMRRTASYIPYYPTESIAHLFATFAHTLSHVEE